MGVIDLHLLHGDSYWQLQSFGLFLRIDLIDAAQGRSSKLAPTKDPATNDRNHSPGSQTPAPGNFRMINSDKRNAQTAPNDLETLDYESDFPFILTCS